MSFIAKHTAAATFVLLSAALPSVAQPLTCNDVKVRFPDAKKVMTEKAATLMLDDAAQRLVVKCSERPLDVAYKDVQKVVVEVNTIGSKTGFGAKFLGVLAGGLLFGTAITTAIDRPFDDDHFVYLEYATEAGTQPYLINIGRTSVPRVLQQVQAVFADRVLLPTFDEKPERSPKFTGKGAGRKIRCMATAKQHPLPEMRPDKALVVVVMPATIMQRSAAEKKGSGAVIFLDGNPVAVVMPGTYAYFYADAGEYSMATWVNEMVGLRMKLEAGKEYYVTQTLYAEGVKTKTFLTRHSKELVAYELLGSLFTDWALE
jgi:hypothetical protein